MENSIKKMLAGENVIFETENTRLSHKNFLSLLCGVQILELKNNSILIRNKIAEIKLNKNIGSLTLKLKTNFN